MAHSITGEHPAFDSQTLVVSTARDRSFDDLADALAGTKEQEVPPAPRSAPPPSVRVVQESPPSSARLPKLRVSENGSWFELPGGRRVRCPDEPTLHRVLETLAHARAVRPGAAVFHDELVLAAWSGDRVSVDAAAARVDAALATLRRLGLRELLLEVRDGYLLDPDVEFALALAPPPLPPTHAA